MNLENVVIEPAVSRDVEAILRLADENGPDRGGELSVRLKPEDIRTSDNALPNIVARRDARVIGFLLTKERTSFLPPIVRAMLEAYPGSEEAYLYGPVCVDETERGRGIAAAMFAELCHLVPGREGILFIKADNDASLHAHRKMAMRDVAKFVFADQLLLVFAYEG